MSSLGFNERVFRLKTLLLRPAAMSFINELSAVDTGGPEYIDELNRRRRRELVRFAYENTDFYRTKYSAAGFELGDLDSEDYFDNLPTLDKSEVRVAAADMIAAGVRAEQLKESTTGGSTGEPLKVYHDPEIPVNLLSWRVLNWWGVNPSDSSGYLYRAVPTGNARMIQAAALWPTRRAWISASQMGLEELRKFTDRLRKYRVTYLVGYVGAIEAFASYLEREGQEIDSLQAVWTTASPLPEGKRTFMENVFCCPVYTQYGSCEIHWLGAECANKDGMHILADVRHLEVLENGRPAAAEQYGDVVVTDLLNRKFPMIRYKIGDRGRLLGRGCSCGRPFPMMDYIRGRVSDSIITKSNGVVPGEFWTTIFDDFTSSVKSFSVHQHADYSVTVSYQFHSEGRSQSVIDVVRSRLEQIVGADMDVNMVEKDLFSHDNGKIRFVTSELSL